MKNKCSQIKADCKIEVQKTLENSLEKVYYNQEKSLEKVYLTG
jgi:hypothetical protein